MLQFVMLLLSATLASAATDAGPVTPPPFETTYSAHYRGIRAGLLRFELRAAKENTFIYATSPEPNLIARLVVSPDAVERSVIRIDGEGVRPLSWFKEDGKSGDEDDGLLEFDWEEEEVRGIVEGESVSLPTIPGLQDHLSIQIAVMTTLLRGGEPGTIPMLDDDKVKHYTYTPAGMGRIETRAGEYETVLYEVTRPGSSRLSRIWHAPDLDYIPVRAEQFRDGKLETVMELVHVRRGEANP